MKIGTYIVDNEEMDYFEENGSYYYINKNNEKIPQTKLNIAYIITSEWSLNSIHNSSHEVNDKWVSEKNIIIYDWIEFILYGYGDTKQDSIKDLEDRYHDFIEYNHKYRLNVKRNKEKFMSSIHKFAYIPKDRNISELDTKGEIPEGEFIFFEDSEKDFRELIVEQGVPEDARADEPILGYVSKNELVFFKPYFLEGAREKFDKFVEENHAIVAHHYNLAIYKLYKGIKKYSDIYVDEHNNIREELLNTDFMYCTPLNFIGSYMTTYDSVIFLREAKCPRCNENVFEFFNSCPKCGLPTGPYMFE